MCESPNITLELLMVRNEKLILHLGIFLCTFTTKLCFGTGQLFTLKHGINFSGCSSVVTELPNSFSGGDPT